MLPNLNVGIVISLFYYIRVVKVMYLDGERSDVIEMPSKMGTVLLLGTGIPTLIFGIYWSPIADWVERSVSFLFQSI